MKEFIINENEAGQRFDKYLAKLLKEAPKSFFYKMMRKKNITLNGKKANGNEKLLSGDHVKLFLSDETFEKFSGTDKAPRAYHKLDIIYEDENILLINKPSGMLSQPGDDGTPSLVEYLTGYLLETGSLTEEDLRTFRPSVCNRLDRNTTGLIAAGKSLAGLQELSEMFKSRNLHKYYLCLVEGVLEQEKYIKGYLSKDKKNNKVTIYKQEKENTLPVETRYFPLGNNGKRTLLKVELITGRAHQIRAHLASEGHSIVGDPKYGKNESNLKGQLLHSFCMEFPVLTGTLSYLSGKTFTAPIPEIFLRTLKEEQLEEIYYEEESTINANNILVSYKLETTIELKKTKTRIITRKYPLKHMKIKVTYNNGSYEFIINEDMLQNDLDYILKLLNSGNYAGAYVILNKYPCCIKIIDDDKKFE